jgi:N-acetylneuraminate synthase
MLIHRAKESGADAAKFQNFRAAKIVSDRGFRVLGAPLSHQSKWKKSVYEMYVDATLPWEWTETLKTECEAVGIEYMSTPYDFEAVDMLAPYIRAFKIGSGDITWPEMLQYVASKNKPVILATGASSLQDVERAVATLRSTNPHICLMQCNTNYTGSSENFRHIHLNVLQEYRRLFPEVVLGLSDHTPGNTTVLGAVALGARMVEKHFTDDTSREGPDHPFSMTPKAWREMVDRTRELECALGEHHKFVADNEKDTIVVQRRCLRAARDLKAGTVLKREDIEVLRPAPQDAIFPYELPNIVGMILQVDMLTGEYFHRSILAKSESHG